MTIEVQETLKKDPNNIKFLRENSEWYKYLNRDPLSINEMIKQMKEKYEIRFSDRVSKISTGLDLIKAFMDVSDE